MVLRYHGGKKDIREALATGLVYSLINHGKIETNEARGRVARQMAEKIINIARKDSIAARRRVLAMLDADRGLTARVFSTIAPRYVERTSGFTTVIKLGKRLGDSAEMVRVEWVGGPFVEDKGTKEQKDQGTQKQVNIDKKNQRISAKNRRKSETGQTRKTKKVK